MRIWTVVEVDLESRSSMDESGANVIFAYRNWQMATNKAEELASKYGLTRLDDYNWYDDDEGFVMVHVQSVELQ